MGRRSIATEHISLFASPETHRKLLLHYQSCIFYAYISGSTRSTATVLLVELYFFGAVIVVVVFNFDPSGSDTGIFRNN